MCASGVRMTDVESPARFEFVNGGAPSWSGRDGRIDPGSDHGIDPWCYCRIDGRYPGIDVQAGRAHDALRMTH
jgi:hypothetical protein